MELNTLQNIKLLQFYVLGTVENVEAGRLQQLWIMHPGKKNPYGNSRNIAVHSAITNAFNMYLFHQLLHDKA